MSFQYPLRPTQFSDHKTRTPSPLRQSSNASISSPVYSIPSYPLPASRPSTLSSKVSATQHASTLAHKRGLSDAREGLSSTIGKERTSSEDTTPSGTYKNVRQSLRPLPQAPNGSPSPAEKNAHGGHVRDLSAVTAKSSFERSIGSPPPEPSHSRPHSLAMSRSDSVRAPVHDPSTRPHAQHAHFAPQAAVLEDSDIQSMRKSTTSHLRTLSKFAANGTEDDFTITKPEQEVVGLHGRRRLQRGMSTRDKKTSTGWGGRNWMDQQRQYLQAYEYLCHIGEAKEWIEDIISKTIPAIVELEEALRDGVTLAEVVQALHPDKNFRIFRHQRLQFKHSDNIALFFRYLAEVELPELFRFELVDLYEKKNIPKVIYCIHALSWLLFRKGIVDFRIGNLVGQLQFENHELEATQKGLDKAGVSMPNFSGMGANFGAEPEPETEDERVDRELQELEAITVDLQAQSRGALVRLRLGDRMQSLWDVEQTLIDLQSRIRGDWSRQVIGYRLEMRRFSTNLQSAARGFLVRSQWRRKEHHWKDREKDVVFLQSLIRARRARDHVRTLKSRMQKQRHGVCRLQAAIRGAVSRWDVGDLYHETREVEPVVNELQAAIRGMLKRRRFEGQEVQIRSSEVSVQRLQAAIRGALSRVHVQERHADSKACEAGTELLQAAIRGMLQRRVMQSNIRQLSQHQARLSRLQAAARGLMSRNRCDDIREGLEHSVYIWRSLQSVGRGAAVRTCLTGVRSLLRARLPEIVSVQAAARGCHTRQAIEGVQIALATCHPSTTMFQSILRGHLKRRRYYSDLRDLEAQGLTVTLLQSMARGYNVRQRTYDALCGLHDAAMEIVELQSLARAMLVRSEIGDVLMQLEAEEDSIVELQAAARGTMLRGRFAEKQRFFKENMDKVIKIQSFVRARQQGEAYKSLTSGKNPPVGTIKNFVHLLNDSDFDFDEEIEVERLRKTVVQNVRQNEMTEQYLEQLSTKMGLLIHNKITLDEVVSHQKYFGGHVGNLLTNKDISSKDPFNLKALNQNSRKKLEDYQELFFILQTQPQYLARLFRFIRQSGTAESECKRIELLMMSLFGLAQKRREEYYLLKLLSRSIQEEVDSCSSLQEYLRGNFFWTKLFSSYVRSPRDRKFLRDLLGPLIRVNIIENEALDLESDPIQIYRSAINNEELRTGQLSRRSPDIPREDAIRDPETRETFIRHLQDLRDIADQYFNALEELVHQMPYGVRYVTQQMFKLLCAHFPYENQQSLLHVVGHWLWKTYIAPALTQPETWGVVDRGLSPSHKRNLGEVAKVLGQVAIGRLFGGENVYLQPLNSYVTEAIARLDEIWLTLITVRDAETHFDIDEFNDLYARTKPTLYIKISDIFAIHQLVASEISTISPLSSQSHDEALREVIRELGNAKSHDSDLLSVSSSEITLTLNPKFHDTEDPAAAALKALFMETKRCVLYIIRIQSGANLMEIMVKPITPEDEDRWDALCAEERSVNSMKGATRGFYYSEYSHAPHASAALDNTSLPYAAVKRTCLENILALEAAHLITRHNNYQDLLNSIALDIRTKHRRRIQRSIEMNQIRATLGNLEEKRGWLEDQLKSYNEAVEQAMCTLHGKKGGSKTWRMPFTRQWLHEKELVRIGRVPRFGSYKYSANKLAEKGVLVKWKGYWEPDGGPRGGHLGSPGSGFIGADGKASITISSDEVGVFHIEGSLGSLMIPGAMAELTLDELLEAQFVNQQFLDVFAGSAMPTALERGGSMRGSRLGRGSVAGSVQRPSSSGRRDGVKEAGGGLRLNVNLLLHLIFKKFYRDE